MTKEEPKDKQYKAPPVNWDRATELIILYSQDPEKRARLDEAVAEELKCSPLTIAPFRRKMFKNKTKANYASVIDQSRNRIKGMASRGWKIKDIAKAIGCSYSALYRRRKEFGITNIRQTPHRESIANESERFDYIMWLTNFKKELAEQNGIQGDVDTWLKTKDGHRAIDAWRLQNLVPLSGSYEFDNFFFTGDGSMAYEQELETMRAWA